MIEKDSCGINSRRSRERRSKKARSPKVLALALGESNFQLVNKKSSVKTSRNDDNLILNKVFSEKVVISPNDMELFDTVKPHKLSSENNIRRTRMGRKNPNQKTIQ